MAQDVQSISGRTFFDGRHLPNDRSGRIEWAKYEQKCRDIEIGTSKLMGKDPTVVERIMVGVEEQAKEYQILSNQTAQITS